MIKVILAVPAGQEVKLIPEHTPIREMLGQFHADCESVAYLINGISLEAGDLDRKLTEIVKDDEALIVPVPKSW